MTNKNHDKDAVAKTNKDQEGASALASQPIPAEIFDEVTAMLIARLGEDWIADGKHHSYFVRALVSAVEDTHGLHMTGNPETTDGAVMLTVWLEYMMDDVWETDELAMAVLSQVSEELLFTSREIGTDSLQYRFLTGGMDDGHLGMIRFTGPNAQEFASLHNLRMLEGRHFHA